MNELANDIDPRDWKKVARKLKIHYPKITAIHKKNEEFYENIYQMLLKWKQANGSAATWKKLIERHYLSGAVFRQTLFIRYFSAKIVTLR